MFSCTFELFREVYVGRPQHPFTLGAVFDGYPGEIDALGGDVVAAEFLVLLCGRALLDWGHWFCHFVYDVFCEYWTDNSELEII